MGSSSSFFLADVMQRDIIDCDLLIPQLIRVDKVGNHARDVECLMENQNVGVESGRTIVGNSSSDDMDLFHGSNALSNKAFNRNSFASVLQHQTTISKGRSVSMRVKLYPAMLMFIMWVSRI